MLSGKRSILIFIISSVFLLFSTTESKGSHAVGADLTYTCLGGNQYLVSLAFYRDCSGISAPSSATINISSASCGENISLTLTKIPGTGQEVTPICSGFNTTCSGGSFPGIEEYVYEATVTLPAQCTDWVFSYSLCCRNSAITNIVSPGSQSMYIEATLNNTLGCNSSPTFSNKPVPFVCADQLFCFSPGSLDPENDSLVFTLITPMTSSGGTVTYNGSFSASQPLSSTPAVTFNTATGDLCMTPTNASEVTVTAILIEQWSGGVLIGSVMRDIQINIVTCTNTVPALTGFDGNPPDTSNTSLEVCPGTTINVMINSSDADTGQIVTMSWNNGIPSGSFTITGIPYPTGNFVWTPITADISTVPYCFTVTVMDDNCPYNASFTQSYCFLVTGLTMDAGAPQSVSCDTVATVSATAIGGSGNYSYLWDNGDTSATTIVGCGVHTVMVSDTAGCASTDSVTITCFNEPVADFTSTPLCVNSSTSFTDSSIAISPTSISAWVWDFGDGSPTSSLQNPTHTYANPGSFNVTLIISNNLGCPDTVVKIITVNPAPSASFTATSVCLGDTSAFTDNSTIDVDTIVSWSWTFGDGNTSTTQNPTNVYLNDSTYNVTLIVTSNNGCSNTVIQPVTVYSLPVANFTSNNNCLNDTSYFVDASTVAGDSVVSWQWDFGDGLNTSVLQDPFNVYNSADTFIVNLIVTSGNGCIDTVAQPVEIYPLPVSGFTSTTVCANDLTQFSDTSSVSVGTITKWQWSFDSINGSTMQNPTFTYSTGGVYNATLMVTTNNGCIDSITNTVNVYTLPIAGFSSTRVCLNDITTFTDTSQVSPGSITSWDWNFGDGGATSTNQNTSHIYSTSGTFSATLIVTSNDGCSDTAIQTVIVDTFPIADFSTVPVCLTDQTSFLDLSTAVSGDTVVTWFWNFGDGSGSSTSQSPTYTYSFDGVFTATLTVTSDKGCSSTVNKPVIVYPLPQPDFYFISVCPEFPTVFTDLSSASVISWFWDYDDGATSTQQQAPHTYNNTGFYDVQLIVTDTNQCVDSITQQVEVYPVPIADFDANPMITTILSPYIYVTNTSSGADYYQWDMGNGDVFDTSATITFLQTYSDKIIAKYTIVLIASNSFGCSDTIEKEIEIEGDYALFAPNAFTPNGDGNNDYFFPKGIGIDENNFEMFIYNRWGDLIYKTTDINKPWDGTANNGKKLVEQEVYVWLINTVDLDHKKHRHIGHVTMIR